MLWIGLIGWKSVEDEEIRKRSTPAVEKLKKQIAELWEEKLVLKKANPLLENSQDNSSFAGMILFPPKSFSRKARGEIGVAFAAKSADKSSMHSECGNDSKSNWRR